MPEKYMLKGVFWISFYERMMSNLKCKCPSCINPQLFLMRSCAILFSDKSYKISAHLDLNRVDSVDSNGKWILNCAVFLYQDSTIYFARSNHKWIYLGCHQCNAIKQNESFVDNIDFELQAERNEFQQIVYISASRSWIVMGGGGFWSEWSFLNVDK